VDSPVHREAIAVSLTMFYTQRGRTRKTFKTLDEANQYAGKVFRKTGVVLGISESKPRLTHIRDIRLFVNGGMAYPICRVTTPLNTDLSRMKTTGDSKEATCERCKARYKNWYPWAGR
jgi:hypothetical protein